jgi:hypothetical protein
MLPPHPQVDAQADELASLRSEPTPTRRFDGVVHLRTDRGPVPGAPDESGRPAVVFCRALRQTKGLIGSVIRHLGLDLPVPDHTTLSRRAETLEVPRPRSSGGAEPVHLLVDSTGLKLCGAGEGLIEKHGTRTRRSWEKLHIGMHVETGEIVAAKLTTKDVDDAYDQDGFYRAVAGHQPDAVVVVPRRSTAVPSRTERTGVGRPRLASPSMA